MSGNGTIIGSCPLDCDTGYWECVVGEDPDGLQIGIKRYGKQVVKRCGKRVHSSQFDLNLTPTRFYFSVFSIVV